MAYNRDLQEDKLAAFNAADVAVSCLELLPNVIAGAELNREKIAARLDDGFLDATALMEYLIKRGVPMRSGHEIVGKLVAKCEAERKRLAELSLEELKAASDAIEDDVYSVLGTNNAVAALVSYGSGGREPVEEQIRRWKERVA
jgi:argininosuccinate lyase